MSGGFIEDGHGEVRRITADGVELLGNYMVHVHMNKRVCPLCGEAPHLTNAESDRCIAARTAAIERYYRAIGGR